MCGAGEKGHDASVTGRTLSCPLSAPARRVCRPLRHRARVRRVCGRCDTAVTLGCAGCTHSGLPYVVTGTREVRCASAFGATYYSVLWTIGVSVRGRARVGFARWATAMGAATTVILTDPDSVSVHGSVQMSPTLKRSPPGDRPTPCRSRGSPLPEADTPSPSRPR